MRNSNNVYWSSIDEIYSHWNSRPAQVEIINLIIFIITNDLANTKRCKNLSQLFRDSVILNSVDKNSLMLAPTYLEQDLHWTRFWQTLTRKMSLDMIYLWCVEQRKWFSTSLISL